ncbi:hypothetical protein B0O80DRAFT_68916 [Mortierella sp. GBAus27b]|nr:hypothetical protein B0O80DRAFT_68916 [Mortierella sp. GBAus27b]
MASTTPLTHSPPHHHDGTKGMDIIKATRKPTKMDHFRALVAHNYLVTVRNPSVFIFGAVIPLMMIGIAIGIVSQLALYPDSRHVILSVDRYPKSGPSNEYLDFARSILECILTVGHWIPSIVSCNSKQHSESCSRHSRHVSCGPGGRREEKKKSRQQFTSPKSSPKSRLSQIHTFFSSFFHSF